MVYTNNGKYYVKRAHKFIEVNAFLDKKGEISLTPTGTIIESDETFENISLIELKNKLNNKKEKNTFENRKFEETTFELEEKQNKFNKSN